MNRRQWLKRSALVGGAALGTGAGWLWLAPRPPIQGFASFAALLELTARWKNTDAPAVSSGWSAARVLDHCAQSIEYSLMGFPQLKPAWFRASVGPLAFQVFDKRGAMHHSLTEAIPGAPDLLDDDWNAAVLRLERSITAFQAHTGPYAPHFAYGELDRVSYERAHLMHVSQHYTLFAQPDPA